MSPQDVIEELKQSGLRGRGGAGFPTALKWQFCQNAPGPKKYVICNADEGDPGAFMDRSLLEADPHAVVEGLTLAGYAVGADEGYIYVRAEYPLAVKRLRLALEQARHKGFLGNNILGSGYNFTIKIKEGAGSFVCGEETALIASIESRRGMPRPRPPFPAQSGLNGKPTLINNVKSLATVAAIIGRGADWYSSTGTENCRGTVVFALTGKVANSGLVEVPAGTPLSTIVFDIGGGTCATIFETGGLDQVLFMKEMLQESGFMVTGLVVVPTACDEMTAVSAAENEAAIKGSTAVLVMSCALGVQRLSLYLEKPVLPALDTLFIGLEERPGHYMEACDQCGQCILGYTAGICPLTACHKGLLNGPCGGTNKGKCEVDGERDCAFTLIYNRLKEQGRLDLMKIYHPPRNAQAATRPQVKILESRELALWAENSGS